MYLNDRKEGIVGLSSRDFANAIGGVIVEMSPFGVPETLGTIVKGALDFIMKEFHQAPDMENWWFVNVKRGELENIIRSALMSVLEFRQLNISKKKREEGINDIYDMDENEYYLVDGTTCSAEDNYFIDLDACIWNIEAQLMWNNAGACDCFLCSNSREYMTGDPSESGACETCICNPSKMLYNNYTTDSRALAPNNEIFAGKHSSIIGYRREKFLARKSGARRAEKKGGSNA